MARPEHWQQRIVIKISAQIRYVYDLQYIDQQIMSLAYWSVSSVVCLEKYMFSLTFPVTFHLHDSKDPTPIPSNWALDAKWCILTLE